MPETKQELEEEVARLRAKVEELETDLASEKKRSRKSTKKTEKTSSTSTRAIEETRGVIRGVTLAGVESLRVASSVLSSFADTVGERNRPEEKDSTADLTSDLPKDIYSGLVDAVDQALEIPGRVIDRLHEGYREAKGS